MFSSGIQTAPEADSFEAFMHSSAIGPTEHGAPEMHTPGTIPSWGSLRGFRNLLQAPAYSVGRVCSRRRVHFCPVMSCCTSFANSVRDGPCLTYLGTCAEEVMLKSQHHFLI